MVLVIGMGGATGSQFLEIEAKPVTRDSTAALVSTGLLSGSVYRTAQW